jgi:hypothetical protein
MKHRGGEFHSLPAFFNACAQKQRAQVLFHRPRGDVQVARDFFVAASLHEQTSAPSVQSWGRDQPGGAYSIPWCFVTR